MNRKKREFATQEDALKFIDDNKMYIGEYELVSIFNPQNMKRQIVLYFYLNTSVAGYEAFNEEDMKNE